MFLHLNQFKPKKIFTKKTSIKSIYKILHEFKKLVLDITNENNASTILSNNKTVPKLINAT